MTLTFGLSPFGQQRGHFSFGVLPDDVAYVEPWPRRMRALFAGLTVVDSRGAMMLHRSGGAPTLLFPRTDVAQQGLVPGGRAGRWTVTAGGRAAVDAVAEAPRLSGPAGDAIQGLVTVDYGAMHRWFEEDDPIYAHPRDPYHRVDVRSSSQHVVVRQADVVVAESRRPKLLFETGLPVRYYLPFVDVRTDLLELSTTISECPYKGDGQHWNLLTADGPVPDAAWSLPHPLAEGALALEHLSFYPEKLDVLADGQRVRA